MSYVDEMAIVSPLAKIGNGTKIWPNAQVREHSQLGMNCVLGKGAYIDREVTVGNNCKIQNNASVYRGSLLADGVFVGPGAILTNDKYPRAISPSGRPLEDGDWKIRGVSVLRGASIGAGAICVGPISIGEWSVVGAGAVVTQDVRPHSIAIGSPARHIAWVGKAGRRLQTIGDGLWVCPVTATRYHEDDGHLKEVL